jgi:hypothetical protein
MKRGGGVVILSIEKIKCAFKVHCDCIILLKQVSVIDNKYLINNLQ